MNCSFSIRVTKDRFPQVMVDCLVSDERGYRLFTVPMWQLWQSKY
jgi:hypothetical protein